MDNNPVRNLEPKALWNNFEDLNSIPRGSKKEQKAAEFIKKFGEKLGLESIMDKMGNVVIRKPGTRGMENRPTVVLQGHIDMVHQKNADTPFDFDKQGIQSYIDQDWVRAKGTTLGADNGIGVAAIMALLQSTDIPHPPLEALFTIDEETGMSGAMALEKDALKGRILLNLDTEDDREIIIGCAGGIDTVVTGQYQQTETGKNKSAYRIDIKGLKGGHSGTDIQLGRANANKLLIRLLYLSEPFGLEVCQIDGGSLRNAIPREAQAIVCIDTDKTKDFEKRINDGIRDIKTEFKGIEDNLSIELTNCPVPAQVMESRFQYLIIRAIYAAPNGVYRMSAQVEGLVETSSNMARIMAKNGEFNAQFLTRSSVDSSKMDMAYAIRSAFEMASCQVIQEGGYPGWAPNPDSNVLKLATDLYKSINKEEPHVVAIHAGLECGLIGSIFSGMDMISFGPTIEGAHSPDEKANIKSVAKFWDYLIRLLAEIK